MTADNPNPATKPSPGRECLNWKALDDWARERAAGLDPKILRDFVST